MGMSIDGCIHKLDFSIKGYQKLIDEHVSDGQVVGTGVRGEWSANTPLNEVYQSHIDAFKMAKDIVRKYQKIQEILEKSSYKRGGKSYSYLYDEETRVKHIRKIMEDGNND